MRKNILIGFGALLLAGSLCAQERHYVVIDQDAAGPGGTDMMSILLLLQSPNVNVLGITVVTGDAWRDEEVAHSLRLRELVGRTHVPVVPGAGVPLVRTQQETELWQRLYGNIVYLGAWNKRPTSHGPYEVPAIREGSPKTKALADDAAHFLVRPVRADPHEDTVYAAGPMPNLPRPLSLHPPSPNK